MPKSPQEIEPAMSLGSPSPCSDNASHRLPFPCALNIAREVARLVQEMQFGIMNDAVASSSSEDALHLALEKRFCLVAKISDFPVGTAEQIILINNLLWNALGERIQTEI